MTWTFSHSGILAPQSLFWPPRWPPFWPLPPPSALHSVSPMPSTLHEGLAELFRDEPVFAAELLALARGTPLPKFTTGSAVGR
jgi:hypothetical protein